MDLGRGQGTALRKALAAAAIAGPFVLALPQRWLVPRWYDASLYAADVLLLLNVVAAAALIVRVVRHRAWRVAARAAAVLGLLLVAAGALAVTWNGATREGVFVCGRELAAEIPCAGGGTAYEFDAVCVAGNPHVEVEIRPRRLPFMYRTGAASGVEACRALQR